MIRTTLRVVVLFAIGWSAAAAEIPRPEHPTPDAARAHWTNLNGAWQFRFDPRDEGRGAGWSSPGADGFDRTITVPFGWESELSGIQEKDAAKVGWYRRSFRVPEDFPARDRVILRFGAVDYRADVWVNGRHVAEHEGGYTPFEADVTDALRPGEPATLVVRAFDPTDPSLPVGKQVGWYTPTSGIWQTVWLESRPRVHIGRFSVKTEIDPASATFEVEVSGSGEPDDALSLSVRADDPTVESASAGSAGGQPDGRPGRGRFAIKAAVREPRLWTPETPHLYDATLELKDRDGKVIDSVKSYFGLRTIARGKYGDRPFERILLNGKPIYLRGALDQSFNPKGVYTAPNDAFLRRDIELAKSLGLNFLRIHIKPDEPRRLYWADRLGMLIMEDMPNTWKQNATARASWERTMREVVARDRNHPAIFCWVDFNETWGLGHPEPYKADRDTQEWVKAMVALTRQLDPTRLVEDNSPCYYDHVEDTDLNSWHFYIDDPAKARQHIAEVVAKTEPGSGFNYCPGRVQGTAPLINSEYGAVSAGGGDRDVSWGFRDLTTQLRRHAKIQGYIYTELSDIEWEHNGFVDYDRSPKVFGYDAFVPGMLIAELQQPDFIGYDAPPAIVARPGEQVKVPVFISHYSDRAGPPRIRWWAGGWDDRGDLIMPKQPETIRARWEPYDVTEQEPLTFTAPARPFVGAVVLTLVDDQDRRYAANFVNLVVRPEKPLPRVERREDREVVVRFAPGDFAHRKWSGPAASPKGKAYGRGKGYFEYHLKLPEAVVRARPESFHLRFEAASKADREKVDWPERVNAQDYPQTDTQKWPTNLRIIFNGREVFREVLPDDPADARGVLSHLARFEHGSYGERVEVAGELPESARADLDAGRPLVLRFAVPDDAEHPGGLCLFGAETGRYPFEPTLTIRTRDPLPVDLGVRPDEPAAVETAASRQALLLPSGEAGPGGAPTWAYTTRDPGPSWAGADFDDRPWSRGTPGFGTPATPAVRVGTPWDSDRIWLRKTVDVPRLAPGDFLTLRLFHDEDVEVFVNGEPLYRARGYVTDYRDIPLSEAQKAHFRPGPNVLAVSCRQTGGGQGIDLGLTLFRED